MFMNQGLGSATGGWGGCEFSFFFFNVLAIIYNTYYHPYCAIFYRSNFKNPKMEISQKN